MSPEVEARKPYGASSDVYSLGCVLLELLLQGMLRERRLAEGRKESIAAALDLARRRHSWQMGEELSALAWRMLDESPKTRIDLPKVSVLAARFDMPSVGVALRLREAAAIADRCLQALTAARGAFPGSLGAAAAHAPPHGLQGAGAMPPPIHRGGSSNLGVTIDYSTSSDGSFTAALARAAKKHKPMGQLNPPRRRRLRYAE
eukprot:scaffold57141_cov33-Tisochrysis_lutea.AAC.2